MLISAAAHMTSTAEALEQLFQALGDRTRIRLLNLMTDGEICVCFFVEVLGQPQPKISRHLAYLRNAGLVGTRREAKWMHYRITTPEHPAARKAFEAVLATFAGDRELQRDQAALAKACCSPRLPEQLKRAPRPAFTGR
jgi:ArsR family transcriptional regulator, arsenate/arsenite/antimonite-responsive transcriptional repressor